MVTGGMHCWNDDVLGWVTLQPPGDPAPLLEKIKGTDTVTDFDVGGNEKIAHSSVQPGSRAFKGKNGQFMHEAVWRYLYTHPVDIVGKPVPTDNDCEKNQQQ